MTDKSWTRVTTIANTLADRYALEQWAQRQTVIGLGAREDLYALAAAAQPEDRQQLNQIVKQAKEAAKSRSGANLGTALHRLTERIDSGEAVDVPTQWASDVAAYRQTLTNSRIRIHKEWIERVVVIPQLRAAGTVDRLVTVGSDLVWKVADLKTGAQAPKYVRETTIQLALYAGASHVWKATVDDIRRDQYGRYLLPDPADEPDAYDPTPNIDRTRGLLIHVPVGEGECSLHEVDITAGREAVDYAMWVRAWRKRDGLAWPYNGGGAPADDW